MWIAVEAILITIVVALSLWPYITHFIREKKFHGACYEMGVAYIEVFYQTIRHRFVDAIGTLALLFLLCAIFSNFAIVMAIYFIHIMIVGKIAIHYGHEPGSVEWK